MGIVSIKGPISSWVTIVSPSGFLKPETSLAMSLLGATPTEEVMLRSSLIRRLISRAICSAPPKSRSDPVTSRNASSMEKTSTSGV